MKKNTYTMVIHKLLEAVRKVAADNGGLPSLYGKNVLGKYDSSVWNSVKLTLDGKDLHLTFNGEDIGVIWTYENEPHGSVGFGAADSVMIRNIKIAH